MTRIITVLLADDHAILRAGLRMLLNSQPDIEVVGEAVDGHSAIELAQHLRPDILVLDVTMPGTSGLKVLNEMRQLVPETRVVVLSMHDEDAYMRTAFANGASGYVAKRSADVDLIAAIRAVSRGEIFIDSSLAHSLLPGAEARSRKLLSNREELVLKLVAQGHTSDQISQQMFISAKTVDTYRARIAEKLNLHTRAEWVRYAAELGLLRPESFDITKG